MDNIMYVAYSRYSIVQFMLGYCFYGTLILAYLCVSKWELLTFNS